MPVYTQIDGMYWKSDDAVFCERIRLKLSPAKTRVFYGAWATDGERVYQGPHWIRRADAPSFVGLNPLYAMDKSTCFACPPGNNDLVVISKADPSTFSVLDSGQEEISFLGSTLDAGYARDAKNVFYNGSIVKTADPETFVSLGGGYGRDKKQVYCEQYRLPSAEPLRWRRVGGFYTLDDKRVFWKHNKVPTEQPPYLFEPVRKLEAEYAYDGKQFFYRHEPCEAADVVASLRKTAHFTAAAADSIASGSMQESHFALSRAYRTPDESEFKPSDLSIGETRKSMEKRYGPGRDLPITQFAKWFEDEFDDEGDRRYDDGDFLVHWVRGRHEMVVWFQNDGLRGFQIRNVEQRD